MTEARKDPFAAKPWQAKIARRRFIGAGAALAGAGALAGFLPDKLLEAASAAPASSFDLSQVKHLVFLMQENRSFDHYFGTFPGVRGFSDTHAMKLSDGRSVFQQPDPDNPDGYLEPYHMSTLATGAAAVPSMSHNWRQQHASLDGGAMDGWLRAHIASDGPAKGPFTMGYYTQADIPFHWALAKAFTLLDNYHCSVLGPTDPNRAIWMSGTNDPQGLGGGPYLETATPAAPFTFESGAETMYNAGVSFKCYQSGGQYRYFATIQDKTALPPALYQAVWGNSDLWGDGTPGGVGDPAHPTPAADPNLVFEQDCANGVLPDVTFIVNGSGSASEHPPNLPAVGAQFIAKKLEALAANEDLWNSTVFVLNYDENDGFFDHVPPPTPDRSEYPEEFVTMASPLGTPGGGLPVGGGFRVPCTIISPWSTGGKIFSGVSDHTSCLRLIESVAAAGGLSGRGPITFPLISRWRRATFGDLSGALVPGAPQAAPKSPEFDPATRAANVTAQTETSTLPQTPVPGADQTMPVQQK